jgi:hypothetical protein
MKNIDSDKDKTSEEKEISCQALFGFVDLLISKYMILITESSFAGYALPGKPIWKAKTVIFEKIGEINPIDISPKKSDANFQELLQKVFDKEPFYFSFDYDLTNTMQNQLNSNVNPNPEYFMNEGEFKIFLE